MVPTECVNLLGKLVSYRTTNPGGDEAKLATFLEQQLRAFTPDELTVASVPRNHGNDESGAYVWARFGTPKTVINVHLDTVEVASGWTRDPFVMSQDNGRLYGLGTADTKGAIACVLTALAHTTIKDIGILFSGDEERSSTVIDAFLKTTHIKDIERVIVCEPTSRSLGIRHRGIRSYHLSTSGSGGHSSRADHSPKPLVVCARLAIELDTLGERYLDIGPEGMQGLCLNIAKIGTPVPFNVIAERGELVFSVRPPPGFDGDRFAAEIGTCIRRAIGVEGSSVSTRCVLDRPPFATLDPSRFTDLAGAATPLPVVSLDFWTEAALWSGHGIDAVVVGPGDIAVAHGPDEYVTTDDLEWATAIFQRIVQTTTPVQS